MPEIKKLFPLKYSYILAQYYLGYNDVMLHGGRMDKDLILELHTPDGKVKEFELTKKLIIGTAKDADISFLDKGLLDYHCAIKVKNNIIAIHNLAGEGQTAVDKHSLGKGKMYLLSIGDKVKIGDSFLLITQGSVVTQAAKNEMPPLPISDAEDQTNPAVVVTEVPEETVENSDPSGPIHIDDQLDDTNPTLAQYAVKAEFTQENDEFDEEYEEEYDEDEYDEEDLKMLQAIQEGRQPEGSGDKTSIFRKLFFFGKIKESGMVQGEKQLFQRMPYPAPKFTTRILAFITNVAITYAFVFTLFPPLELDSYIIEELKPLLELITPFIDVINITPLVLMVVTFAALEILTNLIFGASIPYFLMGIKSNDNELGRRIKAVIRAIIGLVTFPFIIFDLPALVGKSTFKEVITWSRLGACGNGFIRLFATFFIVIPLAGICLLSPFALDMDNITGMNVTDIVKNKRSKVPNAIKVNGKIHSLGIEIETEISPELNLLPFFTTNKNAIVPSLILMSSKKKAQAYLNKLQIQIDFREMIQKIYSSDPFFKMNYPTLTSWVLSDKDSWSKLNQQLFAKEFAKLTTLSLSLTPPTYNLFVSQTGPFPTPYILYRKKLLSSLGIYTPYTAVTSKSRMNHLIALHPNLIGMVNNSYYIHLESIPPKMFEVKSSKQSATVARLLDRDFLQNSSIIYKQATDIAVPYSSFEVLDAVSSEDILLSDSSGAFKGITEFYSSKIDRTRAEADDYTEKYILKSLRSLTKSLKTKYKGNKLEQLSPLLGDLKRIDATISETPGESAKSEKTE